MIVMNSCGIVAFIWAFQHIFLEQNSLADSRILQAMRIADQCLLFLRKGLYSKEELEQAGEIIRTGSCCAGVRECDLEMVLSRSGPGSLKKLWTTYLAAAGYAEETVVALQVENRGKGFLRQVLTDLEQGRLPSGKVGLQNVHRRLKSIYGESNGLKIDSGPGGSLVAIQFLVEAGGMLSV